MKKLMLLIVLGVLVVSLMGVGVLAEGISCTDSDVNDDYPDGKNYYEEGSTISGGDAIFVDNCINDTFLREGYCDETITEGDKSKNLEYDCSSENKICQDAICIEVQVVCSSDNLDLCTGNSECTNAGGFWYNGACNEEVEDEFCGTSTLGSCESDDDCETRGCSGSVCGSINDDTSNTGSNCMWLDCYDDEKYNKECGCLDNQCQWKDKDEAKDNGKGKQGLGQIIRGRVKAGVYTSPTGEQIRVRELAQNRFLLQVNNISADCDCELTQEQVQNRTQLKAKLSNGRNAEIKIMPDVASERALERLRLKVCSEENNCSLELKEVGQGEQAQLAYEMKVQKQAKVLGLFKARMQVRAEIGAENGEIIRVRKPWWAFLASESEE